MSLTTIVSRFHENMSWIDSLLPFSNVHIINKGQPDMILPMSQDNNDNSQIAVQTLPNVGREGHSFYTYLCEHYDDLPDIMIFVQGHPFDHSPHLLDRIQQVVSTVHDQQDQDQPFFAFISEHICESNVSGCPFHAGIPLKQVYVTLFEESVDELPFSFGCGGQFLVNRAAVHQHPLAFYQRIVRLLETSINPMEGFVMERFHPLVFDPLSRPNRNKQQQETPP